MVNIVFVISSYGLGHLTRQIALKNAITVLEPSIEITFVISEKHENIFKNDIITNPNIKIVRKPITPTLANNNPTEIDIESSIESFQRFWEWETQIRDDRAWEQILYHADLIINDIECIHNPIAKKMGKKIINISNFTWSQVISHFGNNTLSKHYLKWENLADKFIVLPFSEVSGSGNIEKLEAGILSRNINWDFVIKFRSQINKKIIFISYTHDDDNFIINELIQELTLLNYHVLIPERLTSIEASNITLIKQNETQYQNYIASADLVINKLGYGTVSEVITAGSHILYWKRKGFIEDEILEKAIIIRKLGTLFPIDKSVENQVRCIQEFLEDNIKVQPEENQNQEIAKIVLEELNN